ncbi:MAG: GGDEF domain-containing protein [Xanthomonadales bacterium]|nr:GGDEF domain-containing protein [Xanthomonadales bacterium]
MVLHTVMLSVSLLVNLYLNRIGPGTKGLLLVLLFWLSGLGGLLNFGMLAASLWFLAFAAMVAGTVWSLRAGIATSVAALLAILLAGAGFTQGWLQMPVDASDYVLSGGAWLNLAVGFGLVLMVMLIGLGSYQTAVKALLTEIDDQRREIQHLATLDALTGLPTLRLARDRIEMALQGATRSRLEVALLFIDLDRFKAVNDRHGHEAGDAVLCEVARRLTALLRPGDTAARVGGDEFLVLLVPPTGRDEAGEVAQRIEEALAWPLPWQGQPLRIGASVGIAVYPQDGRTAQDLRRHADAAMYDSKRLRTA